jgi:hypothetical protein
MLWQFWNNKEVKPVNGILTVVTDFCPQILFLFMTLTMYENRVLRKIFGLKRDEVTGKWRKLHQTGLLFRRSNREE